MALKPPNPETERILIELQEEQKQLYDSINRISHLTAYAEVKKLFHAHHTEDLYRFIQNVNAEFTTVRGEILAMNNTLCQCGCRRCSGLDFQTYTHYNIEKGGNITLTLCGMCRSNACGPHVKSNDSQRYIPSRTGWC